MKDEPTDYDLNQIVPDPDKSWLQRLVDWFKLILATKKIIMTIIFGVTAVTGVAINGNVNEENPWQNIIEIFDIGAVITDSETIKPSDHTHKLPVHSHKFVEHEHELQSVTGAIINHIDDDH